MQPKVFNEPTANYPKVTGSAPHSTTNLVTKIPGGALYSSTTPVVYNGQPVAQWYPGTAPSPIPAGRYARQ